MYVPIDPAPPDCLIPIPSTEAQTKTASDEVLTEESKEYQRIEHCELYYHKSGYYFEAVSCFFC